MLRRLLWALIAGALAASPASALTLAIKQALGPPGWVLPYQPDLQFDFARGTAWKGTWTGGGAVVPADSLLSVTRASACMVDDLSGWWRTFPANTLCRSDKGASIWEARTNLALWSRDLTNAAWAKVTMTAAKTAVGIDGEANAATTITAAGASSTILQTVVQVSTADTVSFFVRRRTGTGTIEITPDGIAFTNITAALATAATATPGGWYRAVVSATLVNPVLGLRITTSGDAVDVDFAQLEAGTFVSPPILTTTASAARAADGVLSANTPSQALSVATLFGSGTPTALAGYAAAQYLLSVSNATTTADRLDLRRRQATGVAEISTRVANVSTNSTTLGTWTQNVFGKEAVSFIGGRQAGSFNGGAIVTTASAFPSLPATTMHVGNIATLTPWDGYVAGVAMFHEIVSDDALRNLTR